MREKARRISQEDTEVGTPKFISPDEQDETKEDVSFSIEGFFEKGGQNKIYLATMDKDGERVPIVTKTPLDDKDFKFLEYLKRESLILQ